MEVPDVQIRENLPRMQRRVDYLETRAEKYLADEGDRQEQLLQLNKHMHEELATIRAKFTVLKQQVREAELQLDKLITYIRAAVKQEDYERFKEVVERFDPISLASRTDLTIALQSIVPPAKNE